MFKKILFCALILTQPTFGESNDFNILAEEIHQMYRTNGQDNNYLESGFINKAQLNDMILANNGTYLTSRSKLKDGLRFCIFQTKGAYGDHFSNQKAWELAGIWTSILRKDANLKSILRLEGKNLINWEIISAPCAIAIENHEGEIILLQGMGVD